MLADQTVLANNVAIVQYNAFKKKLAHIQRCWLIEQQNKLSAKILEAENQDNTFKKRKKNSVQTTMLFDLVRILNHAFAWRA